MRRDLRPYGAHLAKSASRMHKKTDSKEGLRATIIAKCHARGDANINLEAPEPDKMDQMSPQEKAKRERRKEQNRRAAQRCRFKKRQNQNKVLQTFQSILDSNKDLQSEMQVLKIQRDNLQMAWSSHCNSCPVLTSGKCEDSCVVKMENVCAMRDVVAGIKQETPPLSDCMAGKSPPYSGHSPINAAPATKPFNSPYADYSTADHHYGTHAYHQQNHHQIQQQLHFHHPPLPHHHHHVHHHHHQQQQQQQQQHVQHRFPQQQHHAAQTSPDQWQMPRPFHSPEGQYNIDSISEASVDPNHISPMSPHVEHIASFPHSNPRDLQGENVTRRQTNVHNFNTQDSRQSKLHPKTTGQNCHTLLNGGSDKPNESASIPTSNTVTLKANCPSPTLVKKYPDLCRQLQSPSPAHLGVPSTTCPLASIMSAPGTSTNSISTHSPMCDPSPGSTFQASILQSNTVVPSLAKTLNGTNVVNSVNIMKSCVKSPPGCVVSENSFSNTNAPHLRSLENRPLSSCQYNTTSCVNNQDVSLTDLRRRDSDSSNIASISDNLLSIQSDIPTVSTSEIDPGNLFDTELDIEPSFSVGVRNFNSNQNGLSSAIIATTEYNIELTDNKTGTFYHPPSESETAGAAPVIAKEGILTAAQDNATQALSDSPMADDLSAIPKELLFFPHKYN